MIIFLYGEDTYRSREKLKEIRNKFKETDKSRVNLFIFDDKKTSLKNIEKEILAAPFLHDKKLIVIENFLKTNKQSKQQEALVKFLKRDEIPESSIIIFYEDGVPDKRTAAFKSLNKAKQAQNFQPLNNRSLNEWISRRTQEQKIKIDPGAIELLIAKVGQDLWRMSSELDKLSAYALGQKKEKITEEDVKLFVKGSFNEDIFALTDAIGAKNKKMIFKLLNEQLSVGLKAVYIFSMLTRQFRILFQVKETVEKKYGSSYSGNYQLKNNLAQELNLHPYVVTKTLEQSQNYKLSELRNIYKKLLSFDIMMKRTGLPHQLLLDILLAKVCVGENNYS